MKIRHLLLWLLLPLGQGLHAQDRIFTAGFQYRPIFPIAFFNEVKGVSQNGIDFSIAQKAGYSAGMTVRRGFKKGLSLETGINFIKRNFNLSITDTTFISKSDFTIIAYQIPVQGMIFMRLGDKLYMNTAMGLSMDMYPSNIYTHDDYYRHYAGRNGVFQFGALANLGFEYRTEKSGFFYLGASYHLPFSWFYQSNIEYKPVKEIARMRLSGSYLCFDLRYYFHEDPLKPKKKKKKKE